MAAPQTGQHDTQGGAPGTGFQRYGNGDDRITPACATDEKGTFLFSTSLAIGAEPAPVDTNIGIIDMQVIYVKNPAVVFRLIKLIGQTA